MARIYQQTDTAATNGVIGGCTGVSPSAASPNGKSSEAEEGGTAGTTAVDVGIRGFAFAATEVGITIQASINLPEVEIPAGEWTIDLNVTAENSMIDLNEVWVDVVDSAGDCLMTLGKWVDGVNLDTATVYSFNVDCDAYTPADGNERWSIVFVMANRQTVSTQSVEVTFSELVTTPETPAEDFASTVRRHGH